jgi:TPR repeat protein
MAQRRRVTANCFHGVRHQAGPDLTTEMIAMNRSRFVNAASALVIGAAFATATGIVSAEPTAESRLAIAYETLACSSYADAMPRLLHAAEAGSAEAQEMVGWLYFAGDAVDGGVPRDESQAMRWLRHAAEAGRADAQQLLIALELGAQGTGTPLLSKRPSFAGDGE